MESILCHLKRVFKATNWNGIIFKLKNFFIFFSISEIFINFKYFE